MRCPFTFALLILIQVGLYESPNGADQVRKLYTMFLENFSEMSPPLDMENKTVYVYFDLHQILDVDEKEGSLSLRATFTTMYKSDHAVWNPDDLNGTTSVLVPLGTFWKPPICTFLSFRNYFSRT